MSSYLRLASSSVSDSREAEEALIRVVVADDHSLIRRSMKLILEGEQDVQLVAEAGDVMAAAKQVQGNRPDVLVLDLSMPGGSSLEAISRLREESPETQIVVMTMDDSPVFAQRALAAGALGYVSKELADVELASAVRAAAAGQQYVSPRLAGRLDALHRSLTENRLTPREVEVLRLIAFGHTSVEIARKLHLSPRTVETHRAHIHRKLGLQTRAELVRFALRRGLLATSAGP
jgi:two-component system, NarL family, response regulator NreC